MPRLREELPSRAGLHEHARVHHVHALAHACDDTEVVRDQDQGRVLLGHELAEQVEDLGLDRDVERRRRLVGDQQPRLARECHRDHGPLTHAARELVRVIAQACLGARDTDAVEQFGGPRVRLLPLHVEMRLERFPDLPADREHRVQARHRVLEDHRDLLATNPPELAVGELDEIAAAEESATCGNAAGTREDPEQSEGGHALPAARLADDAERLAGRDVEGDAVDGVDRPARGPELDPQVLDR